MQVWLLAFHGWCAGQLRLARMRCNDASVGLHGRAAHIRRRWGRWDGLARCNNHAHSNMSTHRIPLASLQCAGSSTG